MATKRDSKSSRTFNRIARGFLTAAAAVGLLSASAPARADDSAASSLGSAACTLIDSYAPGLGTLISGLTGLDDGGADLSEEAFAQIEAIVEDVVQTYFWSEYYDQYTDAANAAEGYTRQTIDNDALDGSFWEVAGIINDHTGPATTRMMTVGLQGTGSFMVMSAINLQLLQEKVDVGDLLGYTTTTYASQRVARAKDYLDHMFDMWYAWDTARNDAHPINYVAGGWFTVAGSLEYYNGYAAALTAQETLMGGGRSTVLGDSFDTYMQELKTIAGDTRDLDGQRIVASGNTSMCIHKKTSGFNNGTAVHLWSCSDGDEQNKSFIYDDINHYLRFAEDTSKCLHKKDANWNNGNAIHVWDCDAGSDDNKQWTYDSTTGYIKAYNNTSKCIQKKYSTSWDNGNPIHLWDCSAGSNNTKKWTLQ